MVTAMVGRGSAGFRSPLERIPTTTASNTEVGAPRRRSACGSQTAGPNRPNLALCDRLLGKEARAETVALRKGAPVSITDGSSTDGSTQRVQATRRAFESRPRRRSLTLVS